MLLALEWVLYPDDGCWGRAHEMCRLMIAVGAAPEKVWIYGSLRVATSNNPSCAVGWGWHVAPTLQVAVAGAVQTWVIDPSLFEEPVTESTWKGVQGDAAATLVHTDATAFHRTIAGVTITDPTYSQTASVLTRYRDALRLRSVASSGPPPYTDCMVPGRGVQWFGQIAANTTHRWFTWGWPASLQVVWTLMPLTQCPGGPQLSWTVQVERASASECTHWITVVNLSASAVKFEGRYDILG